ncbi:MAG: helix-turn-helix transcriptional regulator [Clostridia bacterium]|nr:helix-turn-helix transcriptional regulator [Clostridia bacterium]
MRVGERIRARRNELGITAEQLASKLNVHHSTIYRWENGGIEKVDAGMLMLIADELHTTPTALMGMEEEKQSEEAAAPKTQEARIISEGVDRLPPKARKNALEFYNTLFKMLENEFREDDENET